MIKKTTRALVLFSSLFILLTSVTASAALVSAWAKQQPILNMQGRPTGNGMTANDVKKCIEISGAEKRWNMREVKPGLIRGNIDVRSHQAEISIPYSNTEYAINYVSSSNLMAEGGLIHRNYNKWIKLLDESIQTCMRQSSKVKQ